MHGGREPQGRSWLNESHDAIEHAGYWYICGASVSVQGSLPSHRALTGKSAVGPYIHLLSWWPRPPPSVADGNLVGLIGHVGRWVRNTYPWQFSISRWTVSISKHECDFWDISEGEIVTATQLLEASFKPATLDQQLGLPLFSGRCDVAYG